MRDGRSLRDPHFFACFITTAFPKLRALPQSPTATAPSRREPFTKHILPLSLVYFSLPAIAFFQPREAWGDISRGFRLTKKSAATPVTALVLLFNFRFHLPSARR